MKPMQQVNSKYRVSIENRLTSLEVKIGDIIENHIPHLGEEVESLKKKIDRITLMIIANLITLVFILIESNLK